MLNYKDKTVEHYFKLLKILCFRFKNIELYKKNAKKHFFII